MKACVLCIFKGCVMFDYVVKWCVPLYFIIIIIIIHGVTNYLYFHS